MLMLKNYEEVVKYDVDSAIKIKGKDERDFTTIEELLHSNDNDPARVPNNPLLANFDYVYEHAEQIYCRNKLTYQQYQGFEQYYTLFKALITKYPLEEDYDKYLRGDLGLTMLEFKWKIFLTNLLDFMNHAFDERLEQFLNKQDVIEYFLKYRILFDADTMSIFGALGMSNVLQYDHIARHYVEDHRRMINLIRKHPHIVIPTKLMLDKKLIKSMARTHHLETFYYQLSFICEQVSESAYLEEHKKFCDEQIEGIEDGILPCYKEVYSKSKKMISLENIPRCHNALEQQVIVRIFTRMNVDKLLSKYLYQEMSKYMLIGLFISRTYETDPYNLMIDIETLYEFASTHNKKLHALPVYELLTSFESKSIEQLIVFYESSKKLPLMEMLYDDWNRLKYEFIDELNMNIFNLDMVKSQTNSTGITYYDISDVECPIIVHNTSISIDNPKHIDELIERVLCGQKQVLSLSVQDQEHNCFYEEEQSKYKRTIKFVFGRLQPNKVGIIWHSDAYSQGIDRVEVENTYYKRMHYTLDEFMDRTADFNEIVYAVNGEPFLPLGLLCEDEITDVECEVARKLSIPILYRKKKEIIKRVNQDKRLIKHYTYTVDKRLF